MVAYILAPNSGQAISNRRADSTVVQYDMAHISQYSYRIKVNKQITLALEMISRVTGEVEVSRW